MVVTGAAGFIGSHLVERLLAAGHEVVGIDSFEDYYPRPFKEANIAAARAAEGFTFREDNLLRMAVDPSADGSRLDEVVADADCVFHLAAQAGVRASWGQSFRVYSDNNVLGTQMVLESCRRAGVPKVVYASSSSVYGDTDELPMHEEANCRPVSPYGVTKLAGEQLCRLYWKNHGVPAVSLRFFTVYGPRQRPDMAFHLFLRAMHEGRPLEMYGTGNQTRDFTFVDDIVGGILLAMDGSDGAVYNLGGGSRVTLLEAIHTLESVSGLAAEVRGADVQAGDVKHTWADLTRAAGGTGLRAAGAARRGSAARGGLVPGWEWPARRDPLPFAPEERRRRRRRRTRKRRLLHCSVTPPVRSEGRSLRARRSGEGQRRRSATLRTSRRASRLRPVAISRKAGPGSSSAYTASTRTPRRPLNACVGRAGRGGAPAGCPEPPARRRAI